MVGIVVVTSFAVLFQIFTAMKNLKEYKNGGEVQQTFNQNSFLKKIIAAIIVLSLLFTIWTFTTFGNMAFSNIPILLYLLVIQYNYSRKIEVLSSGVFISGKFLKWQTIDKVEIDDKNSLRLTLHGDRYKIFVIDQVENVGLLKKIIKQEMKKNS